MMRRYLSAGVVGVALAGAVAAQPPNVVDLQPGFGTTLRFEKSFRTVHVGNPAIADVRPAQNSDRILLLSAAQVGRTSLIVLDVDGAEIYNGQISVTGPVPPAPPSGGVYVHTLSDSQSGATGASRGTTYIHGYNEYVCNPVCSVMGTVNPKNLKPARPDLEARFVNPNVQQQQNVEVQQSGGTSPPVYGVREAPPTPQQ